MQFIHQHISRSILAFSCLVLASCGAHTSTGNEQGANASNINGNDSATHIDAADTAVRAISGSSNAVNSVGNAGNGSGMGATSITGAERRSDTARRNNR